MNRFYKIVSDFKNGRGFTFIIVQVSIVFTGVYVAYLLSGYSEEVKMEREKHKIMVSLKSELEYIHRFFPNMAKFQSDWIDKWRVKRDSGKIDNFYTWRYIQPQYNYSIIEYAIRTQSASIIDFEMYSKLILVYRNMKKVEEAENYMTSLALQYQPIPLHPGSKDNDYEMAEAKNKFLFGRFIVFASDRSQILQLLSNMSKELLPIINKQFGKNELIQLEREIRSDIIRSTLGKERGMDTKEIRSFVKEFFPEINDKELSLILKKAEGE